MKSFVMNTHLGSSISRKWKQTTINKEFTSVVPLPSADSGETQSLVRLNNFHIGKNAERLPSRTAVQILNPANGNWIVRYCRGNKGNIKHLDRKTLAIDYDGVNDLGIEYNRETSLQVKKATMWQCLTWLMNSTNVDVRVNTRIAVMSALLGLISLFISLK